MILMKSAERSLYRRTRLAGFKAGQPCREQLKGVYGTVDGYRRIGSVGEYPEESLGKRL
jgi:hypothetical protein